MKKRLIFFISLVVVFAQSHAEPNPKSITSVVHIGDSQSEGYLGGIIFSHLKRVSKIAEVRLYGVASSSPRHWGDDRNSENSKWLCDRKGRLNEKHKVSMRDELCAGDSGESAFSFLNGRKSDLVIFQFLGNSVGFSESFLKEKIANLLGELAPEQNCLFVTSPPFYKDLVAKNEARLQTQKFFLRAIGNRCAVVMGMIEESLRTFAYQRDNYLKDRMHLSEKGAQEFFMSIVPWLPNP